jgi:hypothetical protein
MDPQTFAPDSFECIGEVVAKYPIVQVPYAFGGLHDLGFKP